jgi:hypothetical protein
MRNLALARARAAPRSVRPEKDQAPVVQHREWGLLVAHVGAHPNAPAHREELDRFRDLLLEEVRPRVARVTYEDLMPILGQRTLHLQFSAWDRSGPRVEVVQPPLEEIPPLLQAA